MASLNKVFLMGNLTRDPELRYSKNGTAICQFGFAVNRRFKAANGTETNDTCFIDIVVWGAQGENVERFLKKGASAFIEGRLQMDQWEDKDSGQRRSKLQVVAETVQFMSPRSGEREESEGSDETRAPKPAWNNAPRPNATPRVAAPSNRPPMPDEAFQGESDDNIPF